MVRGGSGGWDALGLDLVIHTRETPKERDGKMAEGLSHHQNIPRQRGCGGFGDEQKEGCEGHFQLAGRVDTGGEEQVSWVRGVGSQEPRLAGWGRMLIISVWPIKGYVLSLWPWAGLLFLTVSLTLKTMIFHTISNVYRQGEEKNLSLSNRRDLSTFWLTAQFVVCLE